MTEQEEDTSQSSPRAPQGIPTPALQALRLKAGLSQAELAALAGVSRMTIGRLERGGLAQFSTIQRLSDALGVSRKRLLRSPK